MIVKDVAFAVYCLFALIVVIFGIITISDILRGKW